MNTLYLECGMGAAGDMLMAALCELHDKPEDFLRRLNGAGIPGVTVAAEQVIKQGVSGTHVSVMVNGQEETAEHDGHHTQHGNYQDIAALVEALSVSDTVKKNALDIYRLIADAESQVHKVPVTEIHFHELGAMDAVADIVGVCMLIEELAPDKILASPVNTGSGHVRCAHGLLPVPAPATALLLRGVPSYSDGTQGELCTPTGAALLKHFVTEFHSAKPVMSVSHIGYGMGKKDFDKVNCVRAYRGESDSPQNEVVELVCNLDDMTPESVAFAQQLLLREGALDVYTTPLGMKKGRAGLALACMCRVEDKDRMLSLIFKHTTTIGLREYNCRRHTLRREEHRLETQYGPVRIKNSSGFGITKAKPEYDDIEKIALAADKPLAEILKEIGKKSQ